MAITYAYTDSYLAKLVTEDQEVRAIADVNAYTVNAFPDAWLEKLVRLRAYIIVCMESTKSADDLFAVKLAAYRKEFAEQLPLAKAAADAAAAAAGTSTPNMASLVSIELVRA